MPLDENPSFDPLPTEAGLLFTAGDDWQRRACLNFVEDQWDLYALGFKRSADIVVERLQISTVHLDSLVYPICFQYRQYLELRLKEIIKSGRELLENSDNVPATHNLVHLWKDARGLIRRIFTQEDESPLMVIDSVVVQFSEMDAGSFSFRYPVDKMNNPSLPDVKYINVVDLKFEIDKSESILEAISAGIAAYIDHKSDMITDFSTLG